LIKWSYILIGNDKTGKTGFQKEVIKFIALTEYKRLDCNLDFTVNARIGSNNTKTIFIMNRSFQEKSEYKTVGSYFSSYFRDADASILSSHLVQADIKQMIMELKKRFFNVCGVFFENSTAIDKSSNEAIAALDWDQRYYIKNPAGDENWECNIRNGAAEFSSHLLSKI
jgi:hypothetical protein